MRRALWLCATILFAVIQGSPAYSAESASATKEEEAIQTLGDKSALFWSNQRAIAQETVKESAIRLNVLCEGGFGGASRCALFLARVQIEPKLQQALKIAKTLNVHVIAGENFMYGDGWARINTNSPTEEILVFLLGKKKDGK